MRQAQILDFLEVKGLAVFLRSLSPIEKKIILWYTEGLIFIWP